MHLSSETVQGLSLTLKGVDDVHTGDSLTTGVLGVGDRVADDVLQENLEDTTSLFIDETRDTLDTTTTSKTTDSGLGDTLDVITKDLAVTLGSSLSQSFSSFSTAGHDKSKQKNFFLSMIMELKGVVKQQNKPKFYRNYARCVDLFAPLPLQSLFGFYDICLVCFLLL